MNAKQTSIDRWKRIFGQAPPNKTEGVERSESTDDEQGKMNTTTMQTVCPELVMIPSGIRRQRGFAFGRTARVLLTVIAPSQPQQELRQGVKLHDNHLPPSS